MDDESKQPDLYCLGGKEIVMAKFYGIGVGPGDPELMTVKGARILNTVDVVMLPEAKKNSGSIAYKIAKEYIGENTETVYFEFPMVHDKEKIMEAAEGMARLVEKYLGNGKNVAFITLGDSSLYSTYGYVLEKLASWVEVETIPGITSYSTVAAMANRQLAVGNEILAIIPATAEVSAIESVMKGAGAVVVMKASHEPEQTVRLLRENKFLENSVLARKVSMEEGALHQDVEKALMSGKDYLTTIIGRRNK